MFDICVGSRPTSDDASDWVMIEDEQPIQITAALTEENTTEAEISSEKFEDTTLLETERSSTANTLAGNKIMI